MDQNRFDALTRTLAERPTRRRVMKLLAASAAGGLATLTGRGTDAAPRCKRIDQACQTSADCCPGTLGNGHVFCDTSTKRKTCQACSSGTVACNGGCVNVTGSDSANCGACNNACTGGTVCSNGQCCPSGQAACNGVCTDVATDEANCGACGTPCGAGLVCVAGACACTADSCPGQSCQCHLTTDGPVCAALVGIDCDTPCTGSAGCFPGDLCFPEACGTNACGVFIACAAL